MMERDANANQSFEIGERFFYHTDGLGSVTDLTNNTGAVVQSYVYDSFGNIVTQSGTVVNPYTYTGREFDFESGLFYYRARYYDARTGRFLSEDPLGFEDSMNLYIYALNSPVTWIDPFGLEIYEFTIRTEIREPFPFQKGEKSFQNIRVDTNTGSINSTYNTGVTKVGNLSFASRSDDFNVSQLSGSGGIFRFSANGTTGSRFVPANIDYHFNFVINENTGRISILGNHDGFPSYKIDLNGDIIYDFQQNSIRDLIGEGDDIYLNITNCK